MKEKVIRIVIQKLARPHCMHLTFKDDYRLLLINRYLIY